MMKTKTLVTVSLGIFAILIVSICLLNPAASSANEKIVTKGNNGQVPPGLKKIPPGLEKIVFIHYKKGAGKKDKPVKPDKPGKPTSEPECYGFLGNGVKWKEPPGICYIHPDLEAKDPEAIFWSAEAWDAETSMELFNGYVSDENANWDDEQNEIDGRNELSLGIYPNVNVIAVTVVWGYFSGPPKSRQIFEFDILFNEVFDWGDADVNSDVMDLQNIATHELGHGLGLGDIYIDGCSEVTMYGYSYNGDTDKRSLEDPDITGLWELYGQ